MGVMQRQTAVKVWIADILNGRYVKEDDSVPNAIVCPDGRRFSRVQLFGIVVSANPQELVLDDGTGSILIRTFDSSFNAVPGQVFMVVGKPREFSGEKQVVAEIAKQVDSAWLQIRKKELPPPCEKVAEEVIQLKTKSVVDVVRELDSGNGADYDEVLKMIGDEALIQRALSNGELFETRHGILKVLD